MDKHFMEWLGTQRLPMFDIRCLHDGWTWDNRADGKWFVNKKPEPELEMYEVVQMHPPKTLLFQCNLDELQPLIAQHFKMLATPIGVLAVNTAIEDLRLRPWWKSAGPMTEELRFLLREGFKNMPRDERQKNLNAPYGGRR